MVHINIILQGEKCSPDSQNSINEQPADCHSNSSWH